MRRSKTSFLPQGYSGICTIKFSKDISSDELINKLKYTDEEYINGEHHFLYLTQKPLYDKIEALLEGEHS